MKKLLYQYTWQMVLYILLIICLIFLTATLFFNFGIIDWNIYENITYLCTDIGFIIIGTKIMAGVFIYSVRIKLMSDENYQNEIMETMQNMDKDKSVSDFDRIVDFYYTMIKEHCKGKIESIKINRSYCLEVIVNGKRMDLSDCDKKSREYKQALYGLEILVNSHISASAVEKALMDKFNNEN